MPVAPELVPLPAQPTDVPWPMPAWPRADPDPRLDSTALTGLFDEAFGGSTDLGETRALLAIQGGAIVAERYGAGLDADSTHRSWSMAKSWMQAAVGFLVGDGRLELDAPAPVSAWTDADDPRRRITLRHLLEMRSGLHFIEDYVEEAGTASVVDMLFGSGRSDVAGYAAKSPLAHEPGTFYYYSSGTTNIVARLVQDTLGLDGDAFGEFLRRRLFAPIGATTPKPGFDARGTWIASSFMPATARDFARLGLLYLRDGVWQDRRLLPDGWVDQTRRESGRDEDGNVYGSHFWVVPDGLGTFQCQGYEGQRTTMVPALDLILVRLGQTQLEHAPVLNDFMRRLVDCFRPTRRGS